MARGGFAELAVLAIGLVSMNRSLGIAGVAAALAAVQVRKFTAAWQVA